MIWGHPTGNFSPEIINRGIINPGISSLLVTMNHKPSFSPKIFITKIHHLLPNLSNINKNLQSHPLSQTTQVLLKNQIRFHRQFRKQVLNNLYRPGNSMIVFLRIIWFFKNLKRNQILMIYLLFNRSRAVKQ